MTGVVGRRLTIDSNGYDSRRQRNPDKLRAFLSPLYDSLLREIGYVAAVPLDNTAVDKLHKATQQKADVTGLDYVRNFISSKGLTLGLSLACISHSLFNFISWPSGIMSARNQT